MCGIAGIFGSGRIPINQESLQKMIGPMLHRGPDGHGSICFDEAGLAHVRLAIIDITGGAQPMSTHDERCHLVYNGELYNYHDIKKKLIAKGYTFHTKSDTEVILKAFREFGIGILQDFRGMFSFALWDEAEKRGYLVRDRFGIKPLFYHSNGRQLLFGSEVKTMLPLLDRKPGLDVNALHLLMNFRYIPGESTLFSGVKHVKPGTVLIWSPGDSVQKEVQWADISIPEKGEVEIEHIQDILQQAVKRQLMSDVPLGAYLSGGIDSATIVALAAPLYSRKNKTFQTFTIDAGDDPFEARNAAKTAQLLHVPNVCEKLDGDLQRELSRLIYHLEVPKVNAWQTSLVARVAAQNVKVALSGLGGDEVFLGYNVHSLLFNFQRLHKMFGRLAPPLGTMVERSFGTFGEKYSEFARAGEILGTLDNFSKVYAIIRNIWDSPVKRELVYGSVLNNAHLPDPFEIVSKHRSFLENDNPVRAASQFEMENKLPNDFLLQEDRISMAFGLEVRVPFLDEDLVNLLSTIPVRCRMKNGRKKALMKATVNKWLPYEILQRKKSGFQIPIHLVFQKELKPLCDKYLSRSRIISDGLFNPDFVQRILELKPHKRLRWHYFMLFLMIGVNIWVDVFQKGEVVGDWR